MHIPSGKVQLDFWSWGRWKSLEGALGHLSPVWEFQRGSCKGSVISVPARFQQGCRGFRHGSAQIRIRSFIVEASIVRWSTLLWDIWSSRSAPKMFQTMSAKLRESLGVPARLPHHGAEGLTWSWKGSVCGLRKLIRIPFSCNSSLAKGFKSWQLHNFCKRFWMGFWPGS